MRNRISVMMIIALALAGAGALGAQQVLATTSWTAAFAHLAGADDVELLAPYEMQHPPEYELRATDLRRVSDADLVVYAGYESMMERLRAAIGEGATESVQITTTHTRAALEEAALRIAGVLGTTGTARLRLDELFAFLDEWSEELRDHRLDRHPILVHAHQRSLFEDLGANVADSFGPASLEAQQIVRLSRVENAALIVDNRHNEVAQPLAETLPGVASASLINFPGRDGTRTLIDVFRYNRARVNEALGRAMDPAL